MPSAASKPRVWVLWGKGAGGNAQMSNLAEALGWPYEVKQLFYNSLNLLPNLFVDASLLSLSRRRSTPLQPPWPDLVIGASRRSVPIARWIRKQSGGHTRLVHLLHTMAPLDWFDLIITTPQYGLPERDNIVHNIAPLNRISPNEMSAASLRWKPRLNRLPRPWWALLVGGNSSSYLFDNQVARRLAREATRCAHAAGGSLLITTSPRTATAVANTLFDGVHCPAHRYQWRPEDPDNPYLAYLALADGFIVTADSASQLIEACLTGKPVQIFDWPQRRRQRYGLKGRLHRWLTSVPADAGSVSVRSWLAARYARLIELGLLKPPRDFAAFHRILHSRGLVTGSLSDQQPVTVPHIDDLERAVNAICRLFEMPLQTDMNSSGHSLHGQSA
ncbi:MAG: mitochondrial fission ELM1 family protein [Gammaproteobacteria bacterium]